MKPILERRNQNVSQRKRQKRLKKSEHLWMKNQEAQPGNQRLFSTFLQLHIGEFLKKIFKYGST